jgi:hypothetical protein
MSGDRERPSRAERYECATATSDLTLRHSDFPPGAPDILAAMAWSKKQLGTELVRLASQWDREKPARQHGRSVAQFIALGMPRDRARLEASRERHERAGAYYRSVVAAIARLQDLPAVAAQLTMRAVAWDMEDADAKAAAVLRYWLDPVCKACEGRGAPLIAGTNQASPQRCPECAGRGRLHPPYGEDGRRLATYLDECKRGR